MKTKILTFILLLTSQIIQAQVLTLSQLEYLARQKDWQVINDYLLARGWNFKSSEDDEIIWAYNLKSEFTGSVGYYGYTPTIEYKATAWLQAYTVNNRVEKIIYQFLSQKQYQNLINALKSKGYKQYKKEKNSDFLSTYYKNSKYIVGVQIQFSDDADIYGNLIQTYLVRVMPKGSYFDPDNGVKYTFAYHDGTQTILEEYTLKDGKLNGKFTKYYLSPHVPEKTGYFKNGEKHGKFTEYYTNGNIKAVYYYNNGLLNGELKTFYPDGNPEIIAHSKDGKLNGTKKTYYPGGILKSVENYKDDLPYGEFRMYDSLGRLTKIVNYNGAYDKTYGYYKEVTYIPNTDGTPVPLILEGYWDDESERDKQWLLYLVIDADTVLLQKENYSNGVLNGKYATALMDSIVITNYTNGVLNGPYKFYIKKHPARLTGIDDTTDAYLLVSGYYLNGKKHGRWTYYDTCRHAVMTGNYNRGIKHGQWKEYLLEPCDFPDSLRLRSVTNYTYGKKNGEATNYLLMFVYQQPSGYQHKHSIATDSGYIYRLEEKLPYKNDILNGYYTLTLDSIILSAGQITNNLKTGYWRETVGFMLTGEGQYNSHSQKTGVWKYYLSPFEIDVKLLFKLANPQCMNDSCEVAKIYYTRGIPYKALLLTVSDHFVSAEFQNRKLQQANAYKNNILAKQVKPIYTNYGQFTGKLYYTVFRNDTAETFVVNTGNPLDSNFFYARNIINFYNGTLDFMPFTVKPVESGKVTSNTNGQYTLRVNDTIKITGYYKNGEKTGQWTYFYPDRKIIKVQQYDNGRLKNEKFLNYHNQPYTGKFKEILNSGDYIIYKIKHGLKHGTAKHYAPNGQLKGKEKYKSGQKISQ